MIQHFAKYLAEDQSFCKMSVFCGRSWYDMQYLLGMHIVPIFISYHDTLIGLYHANQKLWYVIKHPWQGHSWTDTLAILIPNDLRLFPGLGSHAASSDYCRPAGPNINWRDTVIATPAAYPAVPTSYCDRLPPTNNLPLHTASLFMFGSHWLE